MYYTTPDSSALACSINTSQTQTHNLHTISMLTQDREDVRRRAMTFSLNNLEHSKADVNASSLLNCNPHGLGLLLTEASTQNIQSHGVTQHVVILSVISALLAPSSLPRSLPTVN